MITIIIDALYYCCFHRPGKKDTTPFDLVLKNLGELAEHEVHFIENKITENKRWKLKCC